MRCDFLPNVFPDEHVAVHMVESLIFAAVIRYSPHRQVRQARRVGVIID